MKLRIGSFFSGIGAFEKALERLEIPHEIVFYCEIDKCASKAYSLIHNVPESFNLWDITKVDETKLPDFDLMTWGFPCQDISVAGKQAGIIEGETRSGLYYDGLRILRYKKPKYSIIENVKNLVGKKNKSAFAKIIRDLESAGYNSYWQVLNAKDYGVPQGRERVYIVSIRKDINNNSFNFKITCNQAKWWEYINPYETRELTNRQKRMVNSVQGLNTEKINIEGEPQFECAVITLRQSGLRFQNNDEHPTITAYYGKGGGNFTILAYKGHVGGITPRQCFKLMGFDYEDCDKLEGAGIAWSSLYTMAGNSIVVQVLEGILNNLLLQSGSQPDYFYAEQMALFG